MGTVVDKLLEIDREARQTIDGARQYYENTMREIDARREAILREYTQKAEQHIESVRQIEQETAAEQLAAIASRYGALTNTLNAAFEQNHETWEREMLRRIVAGEEA